MTTPRTSWFTPTVAVENSADGTVTVSIDWGDSYVDTTDTNGITIATDDGIGDDHLIDDLIADGTLPNGTLYKYTPPKPNPYATPLSLALAAQAFAEAGWQVAQQMLGVGRHAVVLTLLAADDGVTHLLITEGDDDDEAYVVGAYGREGADPVWMEGFPTLEVLVASAQYWNDGVSSPTEPMVVLDPAEWA